MDNRTQVLYETAFNDVQEALGMKGYVFNGNVVHTHKEVINLGVYKFCASIYFLMGKGSDMNESCHVGLRNLKLEESGFRVYTRESTPMKKESPEHVFLVM